MSIILVPISEGMSMRPSGVLQLRALLQWLVVRLSEKNQCYLMHYVQLDSACNLITEVNIAEHLQTVWCSDKDPHLQSQLWKAVTHVKFMTEISRLQHKELGM